MELNFEQGNLAKTKIEVEVQAGSATDIKIPYKPGFDYNDVRLYQGDCSCMTFEQWSDHLLIHYRDNGEVRGVRELKEKSVTILFWEPGVEHVDSKENPLYVVNPQLQEVINWQSHPFQSVQILITVKK
jgi:hypothetical protein